ncbi:preprotein translocase subunit SecD [Bacilli bacterium PM5-3]|nr:preprotein translocase subunit SecD [Bacilli bacterium PM5-3]MDH6603821.1 preprotein translocase subunit SecD [Bacilli bacterium PM5-9]
MIKAIKKLFSVDESELDFDEIETSEDKSNLYQNELNNQHENTNTSNLNVREILEEQGNKITEVQSNTEINEVLSDNEIETVNIVEQPVKTFDTTTPDILNHNIVEADTKPTKRSFDFAKEIEDAYEKPFVDPIEKEVIEKKQEKSIEKPKVNDEINKDNYVLKDIISPMRGVVRKETNSIKRDPDVKKSQIIKLREHVKTTEIEPDSTDDYAQTIEFTFSDTKNLEDTLNGINIPSEEPKDTLSETSKFTLIEDSTGEMRLVIDEDE